MGGKSVQKCVAHLHPNTDNQSVKKGVPHLTEHSRKKHGGRSKKMLKKCRVSNLSGEALVLLANPTMECCKKNIFSFLLLPK